MIDKHGRPRCDGCGAFAPVHRITLPSGAVLGPEHTERIWCPECAKKTNKGAKEKEL